MRSLKDPPVSTSAPIGPSAGAADAHEGFLARVHAKSTEDYLDSKRTKPASRYEIKAGWDIPAVLEEALNSDLPGEIKALVRENVYNTATGKYLLIPQGARLIGSYDSRVARGQNGIQVVWNRLIYPDGSSINLEGMIGQDAAGYAGLHHDVDNHYKQLLGFGLLTSVFSASFQLSQSRRGSVLGYPSPAETAGSAVGAQISQLGADVTRRNLDIRPTIKVPIGYRFNVRVNRAFSSIRPVDLAPSRDDMTDTSKPIVRLQTSSAAKKARKKTVAVAKEQTIKLAIRLNQDINEPLRSLIRYRGGLSTMALEALDGVDLTHAALVSAEERMVRDTTITMPRGLHKRLKKIADDRDSSMNILTGRCFMAGIKISV